MTLSYIKPRSERMFISIDQRCAQWHEGEGEYGVVWITRGGQVKFQWHRTKEKQRKQKYYLRRWYRDKFGINLYCKLVKPVVLTHTNDITDLFTKIFFKAFKKDFGVAGMI